MYVLDTDHISLLQWNSGDDSLRLRSRIDRHPQSDLYVTVVSFHEQMSGWQAYLGRAKRASDVLHAYRMMERLLATFAGSQVLPFDDAAMQLFVNLRRQKVRIDTMDLRIACTAITRGMTLLTRNADDFARVPGLKSEDWTTASVGGDAN